MKDELKKYFEFQLKVMDKIEHSESRAKNLIFHQCMGAVDFMVMFGGGDATELYTLWDEWRKKLQAKVWE